MWKAQECEEEERGKQQRFRSFRRTAQSPANCVRNRGADTLACSKQVPECCIPLSLSPSHESAQAFKRSHKFKEVTLCSFLWLHNKKQALDEKGRQQSFSHSSFHLSWFCCWLIDWPLLGPLSRRTTADPELKSRIEKTAEYYVSFLFVHCAFLRTRTDACSFRCAMVQNLKLWSAENNKETLNLLSSSAEHFLIIIVFASGKILFSSFSRCRNVLFHASGVPLMAWQKSRHV